MDESIKLRRELMPKFVKGFIYILTILFALTSAGNVSAQDPEGTADSIFINVVNHFPDSLLLQVMLNTDNTTTNRVAGMALPFLITVTPGTGLVMLDTTLARTFAGAVTNGWGIKTSSTDATGGANPAVSPVEYVIGGFSFSGGIPAGSNLLLFTMKLNINVTALLVTVDTFHTGQIANPALGTEFGVEYIPKWYPAPFDYLISDVKDIGGGEPSNRPLVFDLKQNYPNPFNATTQIQFALPQAANVKLEIFNVLGQKVKTLVDEELQPGYKQVAWDGTDEVGKSVATGIYFYRLRAEGLFTEMKKMLLVK
jgi:hypothetical protein